MAQHLFAAPVDPITPPELPVGRSFAQSASDAHVTRPCDAGRQTLGAPLASDTLSQPSPMAVSHIVSVVQSCGQLVACAQTLPLPRLQQARPLEVSQSLSELQLLSHVDAQTPPPPVPPPEEPPPPPSPPPPPDDEQPPNQASSTPRRITVRAARRFFMGSLARRASRRYFAPLSPMWNSTRRLF
jgi:hypothetical protein